MSIASTLRSIFTAETSGFESGMDRMSKSSGKTNKSILEIGKTSAKLSSAAGAAFSSLSAGISLSIAPAESLDKAMLAVGSSMAAAFSAGGPIGLGVAGLGALVGWLMRTDEAATEAAKSIRDKLGRELDAVTKKYADAKLERERFEVRQRAQREGVPESIALADFERSRQDAAFNRDLREATASLERLLTTNDERGLFATQGPELLVEYLRSQRIPSGDEEARAQRAAKVTAAELVAGIQKAMRLEAENRRNRIMTGQEAPTEEGFRRAQQAYTESLSKTGVEMINGISKVIRPYLDDTRRALNRPSRTSR